MVVITKTEALKEVLNNDFAYAKVMFIANGAKYKGEIIKTKSKIFSDPPGLDKALDNITSRIILAWEMKPLDEWGLLDYAERIFEMASGTTTIKPQKLAPAPVSMAPLYPSKHIKREEFGEEFGNTPFEAQTPQEAPISSEKVSETKPKLVIELKDIPIDRKELEEKIRKSFERKGFGVKNAVIEVERKGGQYAINAKGIFMARKKVPPKAIARTLEAIFFNLLSASVVIEHGNIGLEIGEPEEYEIEIR